MNDVTQQIEDMKARWMTGGAAESACPPQWRDALGDAPNLTLVALAGQFTRLATTPITQGLSAHTPLPKLALPIISDGIRPLFRQAQNLKTANIKDMLNLLAARGVTVHPADWMPSASTEAPDVYGPWVDWLSQDVAGTDEEVLTAENWDNWMPHARKTALAQIRRSAPTHARELIAAKAGDVPAEQRLRLIEVLRDGLSEDDGEILESFAEDRSSKVRTSVNNMLARLGKAKVDREAITEFADFFELQKAGMLSRKQIVVARKLKTSAQKRRRTELANALPLTAFAEAMNMPPGTLIETINLGEAIYDIIAITAATGTGEHARILCDRLMNKGADIDLSPLYARLDGAERMRVAIAVAKGDATQFHATLQALGHELGALDYETLNASKSIDALFKQLAKEDPQQPQQIDLALTNLGLIASHGAAERILNNLITMRGLMAADPRLSMLRLNAALSDNSPKET